MSVLDMGCGMGATSVGLAKRFGCRTHGVTLSPVQVDIARALAETEGVTALAQFEVRDAETLDLATRFDRLWMVGVLGHLPDQAGFVRRSPKFLKPGGRYVLGDWMAGPDLDAKTRAKIVDPVIEGMLQPSIFDLDTTAGWFEEAGYRIVETRDLTAETAPTWDEGVSITQTGMVLKLAQSLGFDAIRLVRAIQGMRKAMAERAIVYGVVIAEKPS
jgi:tocopherol O-methyltransferase